MIGSVLKKSVIPAPAFGPPEHGSPVLSFCHEPSAHYFSAIKLIHFAVELIFILCNN